MNLFELSQNIGKINQNKVISDSIKNVNDELNGLTKDRMCKVYSSYVYNELKKNHIYILYDCFVAWIVVYSSRR